MPYTPNQAAIFMTNFGSFWSQIIPDSLSVETIASGQLEAYEQTLFDTLDTVNCLSKTTVPIFRRRLWWKMEITETALEAQSVKLYSYGSGQTYDGSIVYGQGQPNDKFSVSLPANFKRAGYIVDNPASPSVIWVRGVDFVIEDGLLTFIRDPFQHFTPRPVYGGDTTDRQIAFWLMDINEDINYLYEQYGYALRLYMAESSDNYRELIGVLWDNLVLGSSLKNFTIAVHALCGVPVARENGEVVEHLINTLDTKQAITSKRVYEFAAGSTFAVSVGDVLYAGQPLVTSIRVYEGDAIQDSGITLVSLSNAQLNPAIGIRGALIFANKEVPINFSVDDDGHAVVTFEVGGWSRDVELYWDWVTASGKATGQSVAQALRTTPGSGEPLESMMPATVNPFKFLVQHLLKHCTVAVQVDTTFTSPATDTVLMQLRRFVPPHVSILHNTSFTLENTDAARTLEVGNPTPHECVDLDAETAATVDEVAESVRPYQTCMVG